MNEKLIPLSIFAIIFMISILLLAKWMLSDKESYRETIVRVKHTTKIIHAHWLTWEEMFPDSKPKRKSNLGVFCSACHLSADYETDFCPNCGAMMDE